MFVDQVDARVCCVLSLATAGFFYWINAVQSYDEGGWNYINELHSYVDGGMEGDAFINAVSGIVNRGCHNPVSLYAIFPSARLLCLICELSSF